MLVFSMSWSCEMVVDRLNAPEFGPPSPRMHLAHAPFKRSGPGQGTMVSYRSMGGSELKQKKS